MLCKRTKSASQAFVTVRAVDRTCVVDISSHVEVGGTWFDRQFVQRANLNFLQNF